MHEDLNHLPEFTEKMRLADLPGPVIDTFGYYYEKVVAGETGLLSDIDIAPVADNELEDAGSLTQYAAAGQRARKHTVMIKLNGGLGTSMGLTTAKSLLKIKGGKSFLHIILEQAAHLGVRLSLMNSFSTQADTQAALSRIRPATAPDTFIQNRFPKILQDTFAPASWPQDPEKEWNPPGHGDIYTALYTSGMLEHFLEADIRYAFISNSDNLGATLEPDILGYFAEHQLPFLMEVAERTPADTKGGHIARLRDGRLVLREVAQCPEKELGAFTDITYYRYFNTNNIWINLGFLKNLLEARAIIHLPMILNPKTLDPRDNMSPAVYQVETAMGAAISLFQGAAAVRVNKDRLIPVKKCNDLLVVRSDYVTVTDDSRLVFNPARRTERINIRLDSDYYGKIDRFDERFSRGVPSLVDCESLAVDGDVAFGKRVVLKGKVTISNSEPFQKWIGDNTVIEGNLSL
ncbi:UTP--glucose-1-phosphate uridylyltransferase (EC [Olavius algarvensis associated proteobacterium Delta 3]|nr:UTP--glucose-1-phosphate uridylyltransferase (EC [Olavius algarvensis associated proteobacterium Delta 3]CAB5145755.1 UTP--glucose-1-phosphate uridylyltransferase (EC [Olavius algarvensis associated proteobacterium Delta 3]